MNFLFGIARPFSKRIIQLSYNDVIYFFLEFFASTKTILSFPSYPASTSV